MDQAVKNGNRKYCTFRVAQLLMYPYKKVDLIVCSLVYLEATYNTVTMKKQNTNKIPLKMKKSTSETFHAGT